MTDKDVAGKKPCPNCHTDADPVHRMAGVPVPILKGWFCSHCGHFDRAIARERQLEVEVKK